MAKQKTVLIIEDISLIGRCSSLTALPVLSCAGAACALMPTVLLSSHTGGFGDVHRRDLTGDMAQILKRWSALPLAFDAIYLGYLAGGHQLRTVWDILRRFRAPGTLLFVDPVMGDGGRRYSFLSSGLAEGFREICSGADLIFPNPTEAALLLGEPLREGPCGRSDCGGILRRLLGLGAAGAVLTSVGDGQGRLGAAALDRMMDGEAVFMQRERPGAYPGTGDLFASAVIASVLRGASLSAGCALAVEFLGQCLDEALSAGTERRFGVPFETKLPWLAARLPGAGDAAP